MIRALKKIKENKILNLLFKICKIVMTFVIVCLLLIIIIQKISSNNIKLGGYGIYTVVTGSMNPTLKVKDMILSKNVEPENLNIGDIIVYMGEEGSISGKIVTHRIVKKENRNNIWYFTTKGDVNQVEDKEINSNQVVGKYVTKLKLLSIVSHIVNNTFGFFFVVFIPFVVFVFFEVISIKNEFDKEKSEC